jgi:hypothetical protein
MIKPKHPAVGMNLGPMVVGDTEITTYVKFLMSFGDVKHECKLSNSNGVCLSFLCVNEPSCGWKFTAPRKQKGNNWKITTLQNEHSGDCSSEACPKRSFSEDYGISKSGAWWQEKGHERQYTCRLLT